MNKLYSLVLLCAFLLPGCIDLAPTSPAPRVAVTDGVNAAPADTHAEAIQLALRSLYGDIRSETLPNGLRVYLKPIPGAPVVTTKVAYSVGSADEDLDHTGLAHYLEHLMFKGTDKLMPGDIDRMTLRAGGQNNAYTDTDHTIYHFDFSAEHWEKALAIEADRMRNLRIDEKHEFQLEKGAVIEELAGNEDEPWDLEYKAILPLLFGDGPYGHPVIGEKKHVRDVTAEVIKDFYDRWYHPNNASLIIVGGFDPDAAMKKIKELFGPIPKHDLPKRREAKAVKRDKPVRTSVASKFAQPRLLMGFNGVELGHPDDFALDVVVQVLTGGKTGRLYKKFIEELENASDVSSANLAGRYPAWISIDIELLPDEKLEEAESIVVAELKKLAQEPISDAELSRARKQLAAWLIFGNEDVHDLADAIATGATTGQPDYRKNYLANIVKVTKADVQNVAKTLLDPNKRAVVYSLPGGEEQANAGGRVGATACRSDALGAQQAVRLARPSRIGAAGTTACSARRLASTSRGTLKPGILTPISLAAEKPAHSFDLHRVTRHTLPNGLTLLLLENHRLPIVAAAADVGHTHELQPDGKLGVATLTGRLLAEGTGKLTGDQVSQMIEDTGGDLGMHRDGGAVRVLSPDRALGLRLLLESLAKPSFPADAFEREKTRLLADLEDDEFDADALASRTFRKAVFGAHPAGRPKLGDLEHVEKLTRDDCAAFHASAFAPNNTVLTVVGDFDSAQVIAEVTKLTADWAKREVNPPKAADPTLAEKVEEKFVTMEDSSQLKLLVGHAGIRRNNPDYYKLLVLDYVFGTGAGFTDRLSSRIRDRQGLAYSVSGTIAASADLEPGLFVCSVGTEAKNLAEVRKQLLEEINRIRDEVPTKQEVDDAKAYLTGSLPFAMTTSSGASAMMLMLERHKLGENYLEDYRKAIAAVTPQDVQEVAKKYLHPDKLVIVAVGAIDEKGRVLEREQ